MTSREICARCIHLEAVLDTVLFRNPDDDDDESGLTPAKAGALAGGIGGAAAGWQLKPVAQQVAKNRLDSLLNPKATVPTRTQGFFRNIAIKIPEPVKAANLRANWAASRMGTGGRLLGAGVLGIGGALAGYAAGKLLAPSTWSDNDPPETTKIRR